MIHDKWKAVAQMPNGYAIEDSKGRVIAFTQCDEDENDDNPITSQEEVEHANLIAAAPYLLEALEELVYQLTGEQECEEEIEKAFGITTAMRIQIALAAIKKAKGE